MTQSDILFLVLCGVSVVLLALSSFVRPLARAGSVLTLLWLGAALPVLFFLNYAWPYVVLFYLVSATAGMLFLFGGKQT